MPPYIVDQGVRAAVGGDEELVVALPEMVDELRHPGQACESLQDTAFVSDAKPRVIVLAVLRYKSTRLLDDHCGVGVLIDGVVHLPQADSRTPAVAR